MRLRPSDRIDAPPLVLRPWTTEDVPEKLGFELVAEEPDPKQAPGDCGIECRWRVTRQQWARSG
jgi:hypothetical protein